MTVLAAALALSLFVVHGPDGQDIEVNADQISTIQSPRASGSPIESHFGQGVRCVIVMTSGKFVPTRETCKEVSDKIAPP